MNPIYEALAVFMALIGTPLILFFLVYGITGSILAGLTILVLFLILFMFV